MKKVALCFSGMFRNFETCIPSTMLNFINIWKEQNYKVDIFLYMYYIDDIDNIKCKFKMKKYKINKQKILNILKPVKYEINEYNSDVQEEECIINDINFLNIEWNNQIEKDYAINAIGMYRKIYMCNQLKKEYENEKKFKYDMVWRGRLDFFFHDKLEFPFHLHPFVNKIFLLKDRFNSSSRMKTNDKFFGGSSEVMDKICNIYNEIPNFYSKIEIEGQWLFITTIENIKNIECIMIGHRNLYYKNARYPKHEIVKTTMYIDIFNKELEFEILYYFLQKRYLVYGNNNNEILLLFDNYCLNSNLDNYNHKITGNNNQIKLNNIVIEYKNTRYLRIIINYLISCKNTKNIYSLTEEIFTPKINEKILVRIPDRGTFLGEVKEIKDDKYRIETTYNNQGVLWYDLDELEIINFDERI